MHIIFFFECPKFTDVRNALLHGISSLGMQQPTFLELLLFGNSILPLVKNTVLFYYIHEYIKKLRSFKIESLLFAVYIFAVDTAYVIVLPFKPVQIFILLKHNNTICTLPLY